MQSSAPPPDAPGSASEASQGHAHTPLLATAMRKALSMGYSREDLRTDVLAGLVVGIVALPLSMALSIAVGVAPQHGLYTTIVAGSVVAALGGSKYQVTGPTAAFVVILAPIVEHHGLGGLLTAGIMAGVMLIAAGVARLGRLIQFIPYPVTTGFTAGIATVIATLQLKDAFGLTVARMPDAFAEKVIALWRARGGFSPWELAVALTTLALLLVIPKVVKRIPAPLLAVASVSLGAWAADGRVAGFHVATIGSRFHSVVSGVEVRGIPPLPPHLMLPWGASGLSFGLINQLMPSAFAIAVLGAIESLLSAVVADGMTGKRHDPDGELVAQGIGNILAPFFGGIAATGALARTATNIRSGARSPVAAITHAAVVLLSVVLFAPLVSFIPMASLAGLLLLVAWNMSEVRHFAHMLKVAPRSDIVVLLTCYALTVAFDMVVAVSVGVVLAALLFMRRMAGITEARVVDDPETSHKVPHGVALYEIAGPLFFGAAQNAMGVLAAIGADVRVVVINLRRMEAIDATGLVALESALQRLAHGGKSVILTEVAPQPMTALARAKLVETFPNVSMVATLEEALATAGEIRRSLPPPAPPR